MRVDRLLTYTVSLAGLTTLVVAVYLLVVIGLGRRPEGDERSLLLLSMVAAGRPPCSTSRPATGWPSGPTGWCTASGPPRTRRCGPSASGCPVPSRSTSCSCSWPSRCARACCWTGPRSGPGETGHYELAAGVPHREPPPLLIASQGAGGRGPGRACPVGPGSTSGCPALARDRPGPGRPGRRRMRVAPIAHQGELLGLIVCRRRPDGEPFSERRGRRARPSSARQVGLALHNVQLDSALQASLEELQTSNVELQQQPGPHRRRGRRRTAQARAQPPRRRPAAPGGAGREAPPGPGRGRGRPGRRHGDDRRDQGRRAGRHPGAARPGPRHLPPVAGLGRAAEALRAAAGRSPLPVDLDVAGRRAVSPGASRPRSTSAASRPCRTRPSTPATGPPSGSAWPNTTASLHVRGGRRRRRVRRRASVGLEGHGFVNMSDRLGAFGGTLSVTSDARRGHPVSGPHPPRLSRRPSATHPTPCRTHAGGSRQVRRPPDESR